MNEPGENCFGTTCSVSDGLSSVHLSAILAERVADSPTSTQQCIAIAVDLIDSEDARVVNTLLEYAMATDLLLPEEELILLQSITRLNDGLYKLSERMKNFG